LTAPFLNADNFFIVADEYLRNIYQVDATNGTTAQLLPFGAASGPIALAYDSTAKLLYWTDFNAHTIRRYSLLTSSSTVIYRDPDNVGEHRLQRRLAMYLGIHGYIHGYYAGTCTC